jgi:hypothetical protein
MTNSGVYLNKLNPSSDADENKTPKLDLFVSGTTKKKVKQSKPRQQLILVQIRCHFVIICGHVDDG